MRTTFSACLVLLAVGSASSAQAADMPAPYTPRPVAQKSMWSCYLGANVGGASVHESYSDPATVPATPLGSHTVNGWAGGGQVGCDHQSGAWVVGLQGMADGSDLRGQHFFDGDFFRNKVPWFATATARVGLVVRPNVLAYVKGGAAFKHDTEWKIDGVTRLVEANAQTTRTGWTVGGGFEVLLIGGWSVFIEGNYMDFGRGTVTFSNLEVPPVPPTFPLRVRESIVTVLAGINYRFDGLLF